eukprot:CAMPEP_0194550722 /NCGR_PEP_ID=MMETSP0253-20130528/95855_1 /TAXON_ID=2966 /ORGANISM="Noctiluca scintillans" /LENGTH=159 /DNA_ID=CAMNT_0039398163 /DNA_START=200 /DNA_END=679 /DNA_ORIENTATION=-
MIAAPTGKNAMRKTPLTNVSGTRGLASTSARATPLVVAFGALQWLVGPPCEHDSCADWQECDEKDATHQRQWNKRVGLDLRKGHATRRCVRCGEPTLFRHAPPLFCTEVALTDTGSVDAFCWATRREAIQPPARAASVDLATLNDLRQHRNQGQQLDEE